MTAREFLAFYPQFGASVPAEVLETYIGLANARFDGFLEDAEEARRLYTAHRLTLWAKAVPEAAGDGAAVSPAVLAAAGGGQRIASKRVENVAVTYASGGSSSGLTAFGDLEDTVFGRQLFSLLRLHAMPRYVPWEGL